MNLTFAEVTAILGVISIVSGVVLKIFYKPDDTLKSKVNEIEMSVAHKQEITNTKIKILEEQIKSDYEDLYDLINKFDSVRIKDIEDVKKTIEKLEVKLEKLNDLIFKALKN